MSTTEYKLRMLRENHHGNQRAGWELYSVLAIWHDASTASLTGQIEAPNFSDPDACVENVNTFAKLHEGLFFKALFLI